MRKNWLVLIGFIALSQAAGLIGSVFTASSISSWYQYLAKPELNPPSWVFGPVWTTLYLLMGIAAYLVWRVRALKAHAVFFVQLALNALWSVLFFGLRSPGLALIEIALLWLAILVTIVSFNRVSRTAAFLLVPYLLWVSFATYLNYSIWILN